MIKFLVAMYNESITQCKVVRYTGKEKETIQFDKEPKHLYPGNDRIKYITNNKNLDCA